MKIIFNDNNEIQVLNQEIIIPDDIDFYCTRTFKNIDTSSEISFKVDMNGDAYQNIKNCFLKSKLPRKMKKKLGLKKAKNKLLKKINQQIPFSLTLLKRAGYDIAITRG